MEDKSLKTQLVLVPGQLSMCRWRLCRWTPPPVTSSYWGCSSLVAASTWCTIMVSPLRNWSATTGGEEEEAQEGEAYNLCPASQPGSASQWSDVTRRMATATGRDPELVFTSISLDRDNWWLLLAVLHQRAEHREKCRRVRGPGRAARPAHAAGPEGTCRL